MNLLEIQNNLLGNWAGNNLLRLSWLTPTDYVSPASLTVAGVAKGKLLTFTYTWSHEQVAHEGLLLLGYDQKQKVATAAWGDSWHMSDKLMSCVGTIDEQGAIDLRGSYEAPPGPDWGWRIGISVNADNVLHLVMHNCSPEGAEDLAVNAEYRRD